MSIYHTDVVIIGAGPVGLFAIFECGMLGLSCHVIDALDMVGGQCAALYPEKPIYDIPAYPRIEGAELIKNLKAQTDPFQPTYHLSQQVIEIFPDGKNWGLKTSGGITIMTKAIIIAAGVGAFGPNRPPLENIESYENTSIFYYIRRKENFKGKKVMIAGGGDSAVDWALALVDIVECLTIIHRRDKFRAAEDSEKKLKALVAEGRIKLMVPYQLHALKGQGGFLETVTVKDLEGNQKDIETDILLPFYGLSMNLGPINDWGLNMSQNHIAVQHATCGTNAAGIYAIGDVAHYEGKLKLILTGFSEAAMAAHAIRHYIYPDKRINFEHSTTKGIPGNAFTSSINKQ
jgi:thioredoxin reductase (NADPH)